MTSLTSGGREYFGARAQVSASVGASVCDQGAHVDQRVGATRTFARTLRSDLAGLLV